MARASRRELPKRLPGPERLEPRSGVVFLDDGHQVGVSAAGVGVPFVLLHGIGLSHASYRRCLSYLPSLGFMAVGIDAPGHGRSAPVAPSADFSSRTQVIERALDALGIRRAVLAGHSMGGRTAACLAARRPDLAVATLLIDAALGPEWDVTAARRISSKKEIVRGVAAALWDARQDARKLTGTDRRLYRSSVLGAGLSRRNVRHLPATSRAVACEASSAWLASMTANATPTVVIHGARDLVVPIEEARTVASMLRAPTIVLPDAYHSWLLASPQTFRSIVLHLQAGSLGHLREALSGIPVEACLADDARVKQIAGEPRRAPYETRAEPFRWRVELPRVQEA